MSVWMCLAAGLVAAGPALNPEVVFRASDWTATGTDCLLFAAGDLDGDSFDDVLTVNGAKDMCVSYSVKGWKSAAWEVVARDVNPRAAGLVVGEFDSGAPGVEAALVEKDRVVIFRGRQNGEFADRREVTAPPESELSVARAAVRVAGAGRSWVLRDGEFVTQELPPLEEPPYSEASPLAAPPYDRAARCIGRFTGDFNGDGEPDEALVYACALPHPYHAVRVLFGLDAASDDQDNDGLTDQQETALGCDPRSRDTDGDGLLDGWEVRGLPRGIDLGSMIDLCSADAAGEARDRQLNPARQDVIVNVSYFEGVDPAQFRREMPRVQRAFRDLASKNPDGSRGVWLHFREIPGAVPAPDQRMPWWDVGNKYFPARERGLMHWMQVTPHGGGQSAETADMGGSGNGWAVFAHEFGHQLSLSHTGDSAPGWCPLYTSMMNYAYHYSFDGDGARPHFSNGEFRAAVLDERRLKEKLDFPVERLGFLSNRPFRFPLKDNGDGTTLIDWNQDGVFDEGEVEADINYGGSTHAGERRTLGLIGSAPSLAYIGDRCIMAASDHKQTTVQLRAYRGDQQWSPEHGVANSASRFDPVLAGGPDDGAIFVRRFDGWAVARVAVDAERGDPSASALRPLAGLPAADLAALRLGPRYLLITRHDDDRLERRWLMLDAEARPALSDAVPLAVNSMVPVGLTVNPADGTVMMVSSARHEKHGPFCMQVSTLTVAGDTVEVSPASWTHGARFTHCTSRPIPVYRAGGTGAAPQLVIFHTGWADGNGTWTAWRTTRIGNKALDDGWLTSQLYDEWTRSRVAPGFADGAQGTVYAFRWDPGDHHDWKVNTAFMAYNGYGIDDQPMRDFDDSAKISLWGIRQSILHMRRVPEDGPGPGPADSPGRPATP